MSVSDKCSAYTTEYEIIDTNDYFNKTLTSSVQIVLTSPVNAFPMIYSGEI